MGEQRSWRELITEVREWSVANFGNNGDSREWGDQHDNPWGSLASGIGIIEECGELCGAFYAGDRDDILDGCGDVCIYACDFTWRSAAEMSTHDSRSKALEIWDRRHWVGRRMVNLADTGRFAHVILKRAQGIRGMANDEKYLKARDEALNEILAGVSHACKHGAGVTLLEAANTTWDNIVSKRDWNAERAGQ